MTRKDYDEVKHLLNICNINGAEVEPVDIITFGSPCQDLSVAGKRSGLKHVALGDDETTRSGLFFEAIRIIKEMREATNGTHPRFAIYENVSGAFSSNKGWDFHAVLEALCSVCDSAVAIPKPYDEKRADRLVWDKAGEIVGDNYSIAWRTLDAQFWGVPQRRKRIYLVADFTGGRAGEILFKPDSVRGDSAQSNETGQGATADAVGSVDGSVGAISVDASHADDVVRCETTVPSMQARQYKGGNCVAYSFDSLSSNSMKSSNPFSGCRAVEVAKCIDTTYPDPSKNQGGVAIVMATQQGGAEIAENLCPTITAAAGMSGNNQPVIAAQLCGDRMNPSVSYNSNTAYCLPANPMSDRGQVIALQANGIDRADTAGAVQETLCFNEAQITSPTNGNNPQWNEPCHTLSATDNRAPTVILKKPPRKYIIRRLTPTECARLQGFPDFWATLAPYDPADAEFWEDVRKTHAEITGKSYKPCKDLKKWYESLHTDSAEYKMWGNGIALPNAEYVIHGIAEQGAKTLGSLFDGSGGFPLAGAMNGITPLWASEVEPYCIAVTKSRFKEDNNA